MALETGLDEDVDAEEIRDEVVGAFIVTERVGEMVESGEKEG